MIMSNNSYNWRFFRAGGFDQVKLETGDDLAHLGELDQKLWVALACPTRGLEFDSRTLELIDTDKDGRVRAPEVIAATKWTTALLKNPDDLIKGPLSLSLSAINDSTPEGKQILASAKQTLTNLGKPEATSIGIEEISDTAKIFAATNFNGDGIVPVDAASDDATKAVITDIMTCLGTETERSGKTILPLGEATAAPATAVKTVKAKVDDYFARCRLAAFDTRAAGAMNRQE